MQSNQILLSSTGRLPEIHHLKGCFNKIHLCTKNIGPNTGSKQEYEFLTITKKSNFLGCLTTFVAKKQCIAIILSHKKCAIYLCALGSFPSIFIQANHHLLHAILVVSFSNTLGTCLKIIFKCLYHNFKRYILHTQQIPVTLQ